MSTFRATPEDFQALIRERQVAVLRRSLPYPVAAAIVGVGLLPLNPTLAAFALGAAAAWAYSTVLEFRAVRPACLWENAWLQEQITVTAEEDGLRLSSVRGVSFVRWDSGISVHSRPDFFLIKEEFDEVAFLPKKYLTELELLALNTHAARQR